MPAWTFEHQGRRRSFVMFLPPDWALRWQDLDLIVALHGAGQSAEEFARLSEVEALIDGTLTGTPQKLVAIFPRGISLHEQRSGTWNNDFMGAEVRMFDLDDVDFIAQCVIQANALLEAEWRRLMAFPVPPPSVPPFFANGKILLMGFSNGATMAYKAQQTLGSIPVPASWGRTLHPHTVAVAAGTSGGAPHAASDGTPNPAYPGLGTVLFLAQPPANLIHFHGSEDRHVAVAGGVAPKTLAEIDEALGGFPGAGEGYCRYDLRPGPTSPAEAVPDLTDTAIASFVDALSAPGLVQTPTPTATSWEWRDGANGVSYVLHDATVGEFAGHLWPAMANAGFSATRMAWSLLQSLP